MPRFQRALSVEIDKAIRADFAMDDVDKARLNSCCAHGPLLSLPHPDDEPLALWLRPDEFSIFLTYHLGLPLAPRAQICSLCKCNIADVYGIHTMSCLSGGTRTPLHHAIRDAVISLASAAGLAPKPEPLIPNTTLRGDILLRSGADWKMVDVAIVNCLAATNISDAIATIGGAATAYSATKIAKYTAAARAAGWVVVPMIVDTFGAWDATVLPTLRAMMGTAGSRLGLPVHRRIPRATRVLHLALAKGVVRTLAKNMPVTGPLPCCEPGETRG